MQVQAAGKTDKEVKVMGGMTDRQFDAYQKSILRDLKRVQKRAEEKLPPGEKIEELEELIRDTEEQLQRP